MNKYHRERLARLMPNGKPRWIRVYDNGEKSYDRYTVVFTGNYDKDIPGYGKSYQYVGMSSSPSHPQGFCQHGECPHIIDWPTYGHLGKKIRFEDLPEDCQKVVISDYRHLWKLCDVCGVSGAKFYESPYKWLCKEHKPQ